MIRMRCVKNLDFHKAVQRLSSIAPVCAKFGRQCEGSPPQLGRSGPPNQTASPMQPIDPPQWPHRRNAHESSTPLLSASVVCRRTLNRSEHEQRELTKKGNCLQEPAAQAILGPGPARPTPTPAGKSTRPAAHHPNSINYSPALPQQEGQKRPTNDQ